MGYGQTLKFIVKRGKENCNHTIKQHVEQHTDVFI